MLDFEWKIEKFRACTLSFTPPSTNQNSKPTIQNLKFKIGSQASHPLSGSYWVSPG
jgi:hypothetical protein